MGVSSYIIGFAEPLTAASTPLPNPIANDPYQFSLGVDSTGQLFSSGYPYNTGFNAYSTPLTASNANAPLFMFTGAYSGIAFDPSGDLISVGCGNTCIAIFKPPFSANSVPAHEFSGSGIIAVSGTRIFAISLDAQYNTHVSIYDPPYTAASVMFQLNAFAPQYGFSEAMALASGNLIVGAAHSDSGGMLYVYPPPFTGPETAPPFGNGSGQPSVSIQAQGVPTGITVDNSSGLLLVATTNCLDCAQGNANELSAYTLPLTSSSTPVFILYLSQFDYTYGLTTGP